jgi:GntR family transcriptional repressor for pyruvate dehydrogenase complex
MAPHTNVDKMGGASYGDAVTVQNSGVVARAPRIETWASGKPPKRKANMEQIRTQNVPAAVAAALRGRIADGRWAVGERIPGNRELAASYGVSMGSVREAISALISEGLIETRAGSGTYVAPTVRLSKPSGRHGDRRELLDRAQVEDLLEAREIMEPQVVALAARRATPGAVARLFAIVDKMQEGVRDPVRYSEADVEFHIALAETARNRVLVDAMANIRTLLRRDMELSAEVGARRQGDLQFSVDSHRRIVEAVARQDPTAARAEMEAIMSRHHQFVLSLYTGDGTSASSTPAVQSSALHREAI